MLKLCILKLYAPPDKGLDIRAKKKEIIIERLLRVPFSQGQMGRESERPIRKRSFDISVMTFFIDSILLVNHC
jgi:hypothetical protein